MARPSSKPAKPLLSAEEVVDEWLEDDLGINKPQKKRKAVNEMEEYFGQQTSRDRSKRQSRQKLSLPGTETRSEAGGRCATPMDFENDENHDLNASVIHIEDFDRK